MMRSITIFLFISFVSYLCEAQKRTITNASFSTWEAILDYNISSNGKFIWYLFSDSAKENRLVIQNVNSNYKKEFKNIIGRPNFVWNSRFLIFNIDSSLHIMDLDKEKEDVIGNARAIYLTEDSNSRWFTYKKDNQIMLFDLKIGKQKLLDSATKILFNKQGNTLCFATPLDLIWMDLVEGKSKSIKRAERISGLAFDNSGTQLSFTCVIHTRRNLCYYKKGMDSASILSMGKSFNVLDDLEISDYAPQFTQKGGKIVFKVFKKEESFPLNRENDLNVIAPNVDIWHYNDKYLQSEQLEKITSRPLLYTAITDVLQPKIVILENNDTTLTNPIVENWAIVNNAVNEQEQFWNEMKEYSLISTQTGERIKLNFVSSKTFPPFLSANEKFVIWYNLDSMNYYCYNIESKTVNNITSKITVPLFDDVNNRNIRPAFGIATWSADDSYVLIYDKYDIWKVDPNCRVPPLNMTKGTGRNKDISFRIINFERNNTFSQSIEDSVILAALNLESKENGFWKTRLDKPTTPVKCLMDSCLYYFPYIVSERAPRPPIKAKDSEIYLLQHRSEKSAPNIYITKDFRILIPISNIHPERGYNWVSSNLLKWRLDNGSFGSGILYKPENFDDTKRYPVIFHYYEIRSNELHQFLDPSLGTGPLNISWYVSNGYLVFIPDIFHPIGQPAISASSTIISAAKYLCNFPWVDSTKLGLQGHSYGGYETNCVITQSKMFAAAQESAGPTDLVSGYGSIGFGGKSLAFMYESGQFNVGSTPWDDKYTYIRNSPIFQVDRITTPLLIMHNKKDEAVPFSQGIALFTALRRLRKAVWLLQYDGEGHTLNDPSAMLDFNIRQQQFFDHYLKGKLAPEWMHMGLPAPYKGIISGLKISK